MKIRLLIIASALALCAILAAPAAAQFNCFPSCAETDGRFLAIAGTGLITLSDTVLEIELSVPAGTASFELGIFDGDGAVRGYAYAHPSGRIGEASLGIPTNVFPLISQVAASGSQKRKTPRRVRVLSFIGGGG